MATLAQGYHCAHSTLTVPSQCKPALSRRSAVSFASRPLPSAGTRSSASAAGRQSQPAGRQSRSCTAARAQAGVEASAGQQPSGRIITGTAYVLEDNIDTDQIIPAEYLTLVPSVPEEYEKLGSYALAGLPEQHTTRYVADGEMKTKYPIIVAGANFGCGSSREHAPVALGAAGCRAVVAESYARIFFRNCVATGELYPVESAPLDGSGGERLCDVVKTGDTVTVDLEHDLLIHGPSGRQFALRPIGEAGPVIDAGGIFNYARQTGMIPTKA